MARPQVFRSTMSKTRSKIGRQTHVERFAVNRLAGAVEAVAGVGYDPSWLLEARGRADMPVTGIGGVFFRAKDPEALRDWYRERLGVVPGSGYEWMQAAGPTVF